MASMMQKREGGKDRQGNESRREKRQDKRSIR